MPLDRNGIARRAAQELRDGFYVNLGIGMPTLVANYVPEGMTVWLQSENGLLGMGEFPKDADVDYFDIRSLVSDINQKYCQSGKKQIVDNGIYI